MFFKWLWFRVQLWYRNTCYVNPLQKLRCPSCGELQPEIAPKNNPAKRRHVRFLPNYERIVATCWNDKASWSVPTVVPYTGWKVKGIEELMLEAQTVEDQKIAARENEKLGIKR